MLHREKIDQNLLNVVISSGVGVLHADQLQVMLCADCLLLFVPVLHNFIFEMLLPVQFDRQNRQLLFSVFLIHHEIKPAVIEEVIIALIPLENMRNCHFLMNRIPALRQPYIAQRMVQVLQESLLRGRAERLHPQGPGIRLFPGHLGLAVLLHILHQLVEVVLRALPVEPGQVPGVGEHDKAVPGPGGGYVDQLLVVLQPFIGSVPGLVRDGGGEEHYVLLVPLKGVDGAAGHVLQTCFGQGFLNQFPLVHEGRDDADALLPVETGVADDLLHLLRGGVAHRAVLVLDVQIEKGMLFSAGRTYV